MKIAVIGSGISGLSCAHSLNTAHDVHVFESADRIGGHTATVSVSLDDKTYRIDTGFIVFNDRTYPEFIALLQQLEIKSQPSEMSFSVTCPTTGLEYGGNNLNTLFAQRRNLLNLGYWGMLADIVRFNNKANDDVAQNRLSPDMALGDYLKGARFSQRFINHYLLPMGSAIWSATLEDTMAFPAQFFIAFMKHHGLLSLGDRPQWQVLSGGSSSYLEPLTRGFSDRISLNSQISRVVRTSLGAILEFQDGSKQTFDHVVFACHSDQALALLGDASQPEKDILGAIQYSYNQVTLHNDVSLLPQNKRTWSSWNYRLSEGINQLPILTYNMNILQNIQSETPFLVTLNADHVINPANIFQQFQYAHPQFSIEGFAAQKRWHDISGVRNTSYCGAYWRNGFHEDGCASGLRVAHHIGASL